MDDSRNQNFIWRYRIPLVVLLFLLILVPPVITNLSRLGKVKVELLLAPPTADLTIDSKPVNASKTLYISPGEHTFKASQNEFEAQERKLKIDKPQTLVFALTPQTDKAKEIAQQYQNAYLETEKLSGEEKQAEGDKFREANPIVSQLPYRSLYFNVDYRLADNDENRAVVQITADTATGRSFALEQIKKWGYDPADYEVEFINYTNPFGGSQ